MRIASLQRTHWVAPLVAAALVGACGPSVRHAADTLEESNAELLVKPPAEPPDMRPFLDPVMPDYEIGPGDRVSVDIAGYPELSRRALLVRPDGRITLYLLDEVEAAGKQPRALAAELAAGYAPFLKKADVAVTVDEVRSQRFYVLGAVSRPGAYPIDGPVTVLEALALSGGALRGGELGQTVADISRAYLARGDRVVPVRFERLVAGDRTHNVYVRPGDLLYVPARWQGEVAVLGEVAQPRVLDHDGNLTLMKALAECGWVNQEGRERATRIIRGSLSDPQVYLVDAQMIAAGRERDVALMPGDVVFVTTTVIADYNAIIQAILPTLQAALATRFILDGIVVFPPGGN